MVCWGVRYRGDMSQGILMQKMSIGGVISGLNQNIFGVTEHMAGFGRRNGFKQFDVPPPNLWIMIGLAVGLCVIGTVAARMRIRAVEVVTG